MIHGGSPCRISHGRERSSREKTKNEEKEKSREREGVTFCRDLSHRERGRGSPPPPHGPKKSNYN